MDLHKLNPWNWFKHEEPEKTKGEIVPVKHDDQSLSRFPQFDNLNRLHREIDRVFEDAFRGFGLPGRPRSEMRSFFSDDFMPAFRANVNIASDDKQYTITLEAPGLSQEDLSIELNNQVLVIKGTKHEEQEEKDKHFYRRERRYGAFERTLAVPDDADTDGIRANMDKGLLTINIPRKEIDKSNIKKISVQQG